MDSVDDQLANGQRLRALIVVDVFTCGSVAVEVGQSLRGEHVVTVLNRLTARRGALTVLFCNNGSEFCRQIVDLLAYQHEVRIDFSRPGKPTDNVHVESFNATLRRECMNVHWFESLHEPKSESRPGGRNTTRVCLIGRSRIARPRSSLESTQRISSASPSSPLETKPSDGTKLGSRPLNQAALDIGGSFAVLVLAADGGWSSRTSPQILPTNPFTSVPHAMRRLNINSSFARLKIQL